MVFRSTVTTRGKLVMKTWLMALVLAVPALTAASAQDLPAVLYHVQDNTFGCANPMVTRSLTDPREPRLRSAAWVKQTMAQGRCVSITPQSPWKLVSLEGDVALMSYAGSVGPPGAYYLNVDELIDSSGRHPGETPAIDPSATLPNQTPSGQTAAGQTGANKTPSTTGVAAPDSTSATALAPRPDSVPAGPPEDRHRSGTVWVAIIAGLAFLAIMVVLALQRGAHQKPR
jgi:hypothetical protein